MTMLNLKTAKTKLGELNDLLNAYTFGKRDYEKARNLAEEARKLLEKVKP